MTLFIYWTLLTCCAATLFGGVAYHITLIRGWLPFLLVLALATSADTLIDSGVAFQSSTGSIFAGVLLMAASAGFLLAAYVLGLTFAAMGEKETAR